MIYADYAFYTNEYCGKMCESDFLRLRRKASAYLDRVTQFRLAQVAEDAIPVCVRHACCAICDEYLLTEQGGEVASVTNDGYAVAYVAGISKSKTPDQRLYQAASLYLSGTDLLFRGV